MTRDITLTSQPGNMFFDLMDRILESHMPTPETARPGQICGFTISLESAPGDRGFLRIYAPRNFITKGEDGTLSLIYYHDLPEPVRNQAARIAMEVELRAFHECEDLRKALEYIDPMDGETLCTNAVYLPGIALVSKDLWTSEVEDIDIEMDQDEIEDALESYHFVLRRKHVSAHAALADHEVEQSRFQALYALEPITEQPWSAKSQRFNATMRDL